jgi:hypothetical protein
MRERCIEGTASACKRHCSYKTSTSETLVENGVINQVISTHGTQHYLSTDYVAPLS